jgi:hypothetical protein
LRDNVISMVNAGEVQVVQRSASLGFELSSDGAVSLDSLASGGLGCSPGVQRQLHGRSRNSGVARREVCGNAINPRASVLVAE